MFSGATGSQLTGNRMYAKLLEQHEIAIADITFLIRFSLTEYRRQTGDVSSYTPVCNTAMASLAVCRLLRQYSSTYSTSRQPHTSV